MRAITKEQVATCNSSVALKAWINTFDIYKGQRYSKDGPPSTLKGQEGQPKWRKGDKKIVLIGENELCLQFERSDP
jgi:hypothetical protein